jgi:hypothetical protein
MPAVTEVEPLIPSTKRLWTWRRLAAGWSPPIPGVARSWRTCRAIAAARERATASAGATKKTIANRAAARLDDLQESLKTWFDFYNGYDPIFTWWTENPYRKVDQDLKDYSKYLRENLAGVTAGSNTILGDPVGRMRSSRILSTT